MNLQGNVVLGSSKDCVDYLKIKDAYDNEKSIKIPGSDINNTWYHLAVVFENTNLSIYANGTLLRKRSGTIASSAINVIREPNFIGMAEFSDKSFYVSNTVLDEIKLYNKAFTSEQVQLDMNSIGIPSSDICKEDSNEF
jgi:hypothetical protein